MPAISQARDGVERDRRRLADGLLHVRDVRGQECPEVAWFDREDPVALARIDSPVPGVEEGAALVLPVDADRVDPVAFRTLREEKRIVRDRDNWIREVVALRSSLFEIQYALMTEIDRDLHQRCST